MMKAKILSLCFLLSILVAISPALAEPTTVCILDSGSDLSSVAGWNFVSDSPDLTDSVGHGTRVHELLCAGAPEAEIYMLKCFEDDESMDEEALVRALYAAVDEYGADIVNMSFTNAHAGEALHEAVVYAYEKGVILVAPTGNLGLDAPLRAQLYPAAWDEVIGVGGVNLNEEGEPEHSLWYLTGESVYVCARADYDGEKGTSYAAPRVSALIANQFDAIVGDTQEGVRQMLRDIARDLGDPGYDTTYGWGYLSLD